MTVEKISTWVPVRDEDIVDFGIGTSEQQVAAATRIEFDQRKMEEYWRSLPAHVRMARTLRSLRWRTEERLMGRLHALLFPDHEDCG